MKQKNKENNILKKSLISSAVFLFLVLVVFYFIFRENNYRDVYAITKNAKRGYLLVAILCMSCFSLCEAINLKIAFKLFKDKVSFKDTYKYAISGFFVSSITPSSTGGDPMQLYLMTKDKIKISHGALALLVKLLAYEMVAISMGILSFIYSKDLFLQIYHNLGSLKYLIFLGISLNLLVGTLYFLIIFCKPIIQFLVELFSKLLHKIHFKKADSVIDSLKKQVEEYSKASIYLKKNKIVFVKIFLVTLLQFILYYSIPYFVYLSLGFEEYSILTFISLQSILFVSVSSLPSPGAVGISEAAFMKIYNSMFPAAILGSAMVITRFVNFYIFVLYAGLMMSYYIIKDNIKMR